MIRSASPPATICGKDVRVRVDPETSPPYNWICSLDITTKNGKQRFGSGFKIHIPNMSCCIVVTSGHCVYDEGASVENIKVKFPGQAAVIATQFYAHPEYTNANYDYGIIILPGNCDEGFGWSAIIPDNELSGRTVTNCGYPVDKQPWPQMWISTGEITQVTSRKINYNKTVSDQSGSPVYTWYNGYWTVVGVHSYGGCPNSAPRITSEMIEHFLDNTQNLKKYALQLHDCPDVYVRCDGTGVDGSNGTEGGVINCQYKPPEEWETFYIYPVEVTPSLATDEEQKYIVVLKNDFWKTSVVRLDGSGMTHFVENGGGGVVNCLFSGIHPYPLESAFFLEKDQQGYCSFRSVKFPNCYIRADGHEVTAHSDYGGGLVNCQYYNTGEAPTKFELFVLKDEQ